MDSVKTIFRLIVRLGIIAIILVGIQKVLTTPRYLQAIMPYVNQVEELLEKDQFSEIYTWKWRAEEQSTDR